EGQSISCSFIAAAGSPKAVCLVGDTDVTEGFLSQGWAELAEGITDESYVGAAASAQRREAGIWGDGPPYSAGGRWTPERRGRRGNLALEGTGGFTLACVAVLLGVALAMVFVS